MKKLISVLICLGILGGLASCSKETTITKSSEEATTTEATAGDTNGSVDNEAISAVGDIEVDEGLLTVTITVPAEFAGEDVSQESIDEAVKEKGYISGTVNEDGSVTYVMTKARHNDLMKELSDGFDEALQDMVDSDEYPRFKAITHNEDFTDFTISYDGEELGLVDTLSVLVFYYEGGLYGVFNGERADNVHVAFKNADTGEIIQESNSKDMGTSESE